MGDEKKEITIVENEFIWAYFAIGVFVLALMLRFLWGPGGLMVDRFDFHRWLLVLVALGFGFGLGWLLFPRRLPIMHSDEES